MKRWVETDTGWDLSFDGRFVATVFVAPWSLRWFVNADTGLNDGGRHVGAFATLDAAKAAAEKLLPGRTR